MNRRVVLIAFLSVLSLLVVAARVAAEGISGVIELDYARTSSTNEAGGTFTDTKSNTLLQRYILNFDRTLYPNLKFLAGGIFERTNSDFTENGVGAESTLTKVIPTAALRLDTAIMSAQLGYTKREEKNESSGAPSFTNIQDTYYASFGWRPEALPSVNAQFTRTYTYDKERLFVDQMNDQAQVGLIYKPRNELELDYNGQYTDLQDRIQSLEVEQVTNNFRVNYVQTFFNRLALSTTYRYNRIDTTTTSSGRGEVSTQVFPFSGLSALNNNATMASLDLNPAVVDGDLTTSSGINIGPVPAGGNNNLRQIGLDFFSAPAVNTLHVWVDRQLPDAVANSFTWDVYISSDNLNWTLSQPAASATFGPFTNMFEIRFPDVSSRYIKVVTRPLSPAVVVPPGFDVSSIFVTELQAFLRQQAGSLSGKSFLESHLLELNTRTKILDRPYVYHDLFVWYQLTNPGSVSLYTITNAVTLSHALSRVFSTLVRVSRDDTEEIQGHGVTYTYTAALTAVPLPTLNHTLIVSGKHQTVGGLSNDSKSAFLNNTALLYKGVSVSLGGGLSTTTSESDRKTDSTNLVFGVSLNPRSNLTIDLGYNDTSSDLTGGGLPDVSTFTRTGSIAVNYQPFDALYLYGAISTFSQNDLPDNVTKQFSGTWSPFQGGALQVSVSYDQELRTEDNGKLTTFVPSIRWNITPRGSLTASYQKLDDTSLSQNIHSETFSVQFRTSF